MHRVGQGRATFPFEDMTQARVRALRSLGPRQASAFTTGHAKTPPLAQRGPGLGQLVVLVLLILLVITGIPLILLGLAELIVIAFPVGNHLRCQQFFDVVLREVRGLA